MLLKQYLNEKERLYLLDVALNVNYNKTANGTNVYRKTLDELNDEKLNLIVLRIKKEFEFYYKNYIYREHYSCFVKINNFGWVSQHTDGFAFNAHTINTNVLLKKPSDGGFIIHGNSKIIMNEGDLYMLDTDISHGISSLKSDDEYYSLLIWHSK
jgi:hypothetical protein